VEYDHQGTLLRSFVYGPGIDEPICMIDWVGSAVYYYHFDGLGSVTALSDENGNIVERYSYDVFGEPNRVSSVGNPYMFTGRRYDRETQLYYYRARYYNPFIGRFLQTDPIAYQDISNFYTYCRNNPINSVDPRGELAITAGGIVITIIVAQVAWWSFKLWRCRVWIERLQKKSDELMEKHTEPNTGCVKWSLYWATLTNTKEYKKAMKWRSFFSITIAPIPTRPQCCLGMWE